MRGSVSSVSTASLSPLTTLSTPAGRPGFEQQLSKPHRHRRIALRRLENEGVAAGERRREFPHRDHGREIERRDAGDDAKRLAHGIKIDARTGAVAVFALEQVRNAAGEFDDFEAALDVALGVGKRLAVLGGQEPRQRVEFLLGQFEEFHHHPRAPLRVGRRPAGCAASATAMACSTSECLASATLACTSPVLGLKTSPNRPDRALHLFAADEVADLAHGLVSLDCGASAGCILGLL